MSYLFAVVIAVAVVLLTTIVHYEAVRLLEGFARHPRHGHRAVLMGVTSALILVHLAEIGLYALVYWLASGPLGLGRFVGGEMGWADYFHYAAETYASLGSGDLHTEGDMRLIAAVSPLNGILLLAWSGAFLFSLFDQLRQGPPAVPASDAPPPRG